MRTLHITRNLDGPVGIDVQLPHEYFTNNEAVRGKVCIHPTARPNGIRIAFVGRCKMALSPGSSQRTNHKSTLELFSFTRILFDSKASTDGYAILERGVGGSGKVELPFEFIFPNEVLKAPSDDYRPRSGFEHLKGHALPTSMEFYGNRVEYLLEILIHRKGDWLPDEMMELKLPFRPTAFSTTSSSFVECSENLELCIRGQQLNPKNEQNPDTLTRLKWATLSKYQHEIPEARWKITARCPELLVAGNTIPISFSFLHLGHSPQISRVPTVQIRQINVTLTCILTVRIPYSGITGDRDTVRSTEREVFSKIFTQSKTMSHGLRLAEVGNLVLPPTILPSFQTYGIRLAYRLEVIVKGECAQQKFRVPALRGACTVVCVTQRLQQRMPNTRGAITGPSIPRQHAQQSIYTEEQLPAYEPAPSYEESVQRFRTASGDPEGFFHRGLRRS